jgi:hypothetical protein
VCCERKEEEKLKKRGRLNSRELETEQRTGENRGGAEEENRAEENSGRAEPEKTGENAREQSRAQRGERAEQ